MVKYGLVVSSVNPLTVGGSLGRIAGSRDAARVSFGQMFRDACGNRAMEEILSTTGLSLEMARAIRGGLTHNVGRDVHEILLQRLLDARWITTGHLGHAKRLLDKIFQRPPASPSRDFHRPHSAQLWMRT